MVAGSWADDDRLGFPQRVPEWVLGATSLTGAMADCPLSSFTASSVALTQWTATVDNENAC